MQSSEMFLDIPTSFVVFIGTFLLIKLFVYYRGIGTDNRRYPPSLPWLPVIGSILFLPHFTKMHLYFTKNMKKLGNLVAFKLASNYAAILNGRDTIQEAFVKRSTDFADRPPVFMDLLFNPTRSGITRATYDAKFKQYHSLTLSILKKFGFGNKLIEDRIQREVETLKKIIRSSKGASIYPSEEIMHCVMNVMFSIMFGRRLTTFDLQAKGFIQTVKDSFKMFVHTARLNYFPWLRYFPRYKKIIENASAMNDGIRRLMEEKIDYCSTEETEESFISCFVKEEGPDYDRVQLERTLRDFFLAGSDTVTNTLEWSLILLANHPLIQVRLQEEIDSVVPRDRLPCLDDKSKLPYVEATMMELMRIKTIAPLGLMHHTLRDTQVGGYFIPANTRVIANLHSAHMDPDVWPEPEEFRPTRFLDENGSVVNKDLIIPFSLGKRSCLGEILARQEFFLFLTGLVQRFSIRPPEGQNKIDSVELKDVILKPSVFHIRFLER